MTSRNPEQVQQELSNNDALQMATLWDNSLGDDFNDADDYQFFSETLAEQGGDTPMLSGGSKNSSIELHSGDEGDVVEGVCDFRLFGKQTFHLTMKQLTTLENDESQQPFRYMLHARTSDASRMNEETMTYLNKGQWYKVSLAATPKDRFANASNIVRTCIAIHFHDYKEQKKETELWNQWLVFLVCVNFFAL
eukprot:Colp12_sorted_trinity150504_noHs@23263